MSFNADIYRPFSCNKAFCNPRLVCMVLHPHKQFSKKPIFFRAKLNSIRRQSYFAYIG